MIATTINMHPATLDSIARAAERLNTTRREIVVSLLRHLKYNIEDYRGGYTLVNYQRDDPDRRWHCFSIRFSPEDMACLGDMRHFTKCSVSLLVEMAAERFHDRVLREKKAFVHRGDRSVRGSIVDLPAEKLT